MGAEDWSAAGALTCSRVSSRGVPVKDLGSPRVSSICFRNLLVLVEIESFRAPVVSRSVPGPGLGKCWPFGPFWQVLRAKVPCCSNILGAKAEI